MFETHAKDITPSPFDYDEGLLELAVVRQRFHAEWFYVAQHIRSDEGELSSNMLLIDDINEFKALVSEPTTSSWIRDIYLVTPAAVNKAGVWMIDLLLEMKEVTPSPTLVNRNFIYKVNNAAGYYFSTRVDGNWEGLPSKTLYRR
ncbi:hypothetical protein [Pseudomonas sp. TWRC1-2]|uniref:hypothetical protein n=1 Tax=Pseudomonas sp. TWRC1-2 TaxID=2804628 RepID=UPI003CEECA84